MVHSERPLQEKMTLFWHNHFATGYTKVAGALGAAEGARYMAAKASEDPGGVRGQIEMLRDNALGNFRDILMNIAKDTAMLVWLDGRTNTRAKPQENFGREIMELFTMGVGNYTEADVYAARARVHRLESGSAPGAADDPAQHYEFVYNAGQHDTGDEDLQFSDLSGRQPDDSGAARPPTACRTASISSTRWPAIRTPAVPGAEAVPVLRQRVRAIPTRRSSTRIASVYLQSRYDMRAVVREVLLSPQFWDPDVDLRALRLAGRIRRPRAEGHRLGRLLGERRADAAVQHGAGALRAARRGGLGRGPRPGSRPARCWRG